MRTQNIITGFFVILFFFVASCSEDNIKPDADFTGQGQALGTVVIGDAVDKEYFLPTDRTLYRDTVYQLNGLVRVPDSVTLTIQAGTVIKGLPGAIPGTLIIERGGKIKAKGTAASPIIFTSNTPGGGQWGGVIILGKAFSNISAGAHGSPADFKGAIEEIPNSLSSGFYGTSLDENNGLPVTPTTNELDNSGILQYVNIAYAGAKINDNPRLSGLTLGGVGRGTLIDHVIVNYCEADGIRWLGGTVRMKYIFTFLNERDDLKIEEGNLSKLQFAIVWKKVDPASAVDANGPNGIDSPDHGNAVASSFNLTTNSTFSNITMIGPENTYSNGRANQNYCEFGGFSNGISIRGSSRLDILNSLIVGFGFYQYYLQDTSTFGTKAISRNNRFIAVDTYYNQGRISNLGENFSHSKWLNESLLTSHRCDSGGEAIWTLAGLHKSIWNNTLVNSSPIPEPGADVLNGARFTDIVLAQGGFNIVPFRGAVNGAGTSGPGSPNAWSFNTIWHSLVLDPQ